MIQTDASKSGSGAIWNGVSTGEKWSEKEENLHINVLELTAAKFAILTFTKGQSNIAIHLQIDNKTALSYLLKMRRTLAHQQVYLVLPSQQTNYNVCRVPSQCSKRACRLGMKKCQGQFRMETRCFGFPRDCNTHAKTNSGSACIQTLPPTSSMRCMETRPRQYSNRCIPSSLGQGVQFCSPFSLISRVLRKILQEKIDYLIIVTPTWQTQPW